MWILSLLLFTACHRGIVGDPSETDSPVDEDGDGFPSSIDCDDRDPAIYPGGLETCNGQDDDCDGEADEGLMTPWYEDVDGDGFGDPQTVRDACEPPGSDWLAEGGDCDDTDSCVYPGATDTCDGVDSDCDGRDNGCGLEGVFDAVNADSILMGESQDNYAGEFLVLSDVGGDGLLDLVVASEQYPNGGRVYVVDGPWPEAGNLGDAHAILSCNGQCSQAGRSLDAGDVDGDGASDVLIGTPHNVFGRPGGGAFLAYGPLSGSMDLSGADAIVIGSRSETDEAGHGCGLGDLDADGFEDIVVGAYEDDRGSEQGGVVYVWQGPLTGLFDLSSATGVLLGENRGGMAGYRLRAGADMNGDGRGDIQIAAVEDTGGAPRSGTVYIVHGPVTGTLSLADAEATLRGEYPNSYTGESINTGDLDADGYDDVAIGAPFAAGEGRAYVVRGPMSGEVDLGAADIVLGGVSGNTGMAVAIGLVDQDSWGDILVGADTVENHGSTYLVYGPVSGWVDLGGADAVFKGRINSLFGSATEIGDLDQDGWGDLVIGAHTDSQRGAVFTWYGD